MATKNVQVCDHCGKTRKVESYRVVIEYNDPKTDNAPPDERIVEQHLADWCPSCLQGAGRSIERWCSEQVRRERKGKD